MQEMSDGQDKMTSTLRGLSVAGVDCVSGTGSKPHHRRLFSTRTFSTERIHQALTIWAPDNDALNL